MTRRDIGRALRRFWPLATLVVLLMVAVGAAASFLPQKRYQANALIYAEPTSSLALAQGTTVVPLILPAVVQQVESDLFKRQVESIYPDAGKATLTASNVAGTPVVTITGESTNPHTGAMTANVAALEVRLKPITRAIRITVLDPAGVPRSPSSPMPVPILIGCTILGLILALFAALLADGLRKRLASAETVRKDFGLTVLGEITRSRRLKQSPAELFADPSASAATEEYQRLRTNFELLAGDVRTVAITSWGEGEGKTTVTANLAWAMASLGRHVTMVDLDLRRPAIHELLELDVAEGVGDLVAATPNRVRRSVKATELPELKVITAGRMIEQPAKAAERALPAIADAISDQLLLIDTAPLLAAETAQVAAMVDALVIVIDVRRRQPSELEALLQLLQLTQTRVLGVVLNRVRRADQERRTPGYYYAVPRGAERSLG